MCCVVDYMVDINSTLTAVIKLIQLFSVTDNFCIVVHKLFTEMPS